MEDQDLSYPSKMVTVKKILIANRGVCACRIMKTCDNMGIEYVTIFTQEDNQSIHVTESKEKYQVQSYMDIDEIIRVAIRSSSNAIHPGYGFQAENPKFPQKCSETEIIFIGPTAENMLLLGNKVKAREMARQENLPVAPSSKLITTVQEALQWGDAIGYPVLMKSCHGGGGIGIELCENGEEVRQKFPSCRNHFRKIFGHPDLYMEKFISKARHIEVQVFGDGKGNVVHLGERECSIQRRYQKLIEESPSPVLTSQSRIEVCELAVKLCKSFSYQSAGTVEFLFDEVQNQFYFLEVNTRLQVEHRVTELRYSIDLVEWMIRQAYNETAIDLTAVSFQPLGHAIECRINAEDPLKNFKPTSGVLTEVSLPDDESLGQKCLVDTWVRRGCQVSSTYDSSLANIISWARTREQATQEMLNTLSSTRISGPPNNLDYSRKLLESDAFTTGKTYANMPIPFDYRPRCIEVITPGLLTTVQDWPGRQRRGLWRIGVPPSGPMDHLASRVANSLLGNQETDAVLEVTQQGPTLKFHCDTSFALTGASMNVTLDDQPVDMWRRIPVNSGSILKIDTLSSGFGSRAYLGVAGGLDVATYLGSRSTFPNGNLGGYQGRALRPGDVIPVGLSKNFQLEYPTTFNPTAITSQYSTEWQIGVLPGPHVNPEYLTDEDVEMFYSTDWQVHHNSNRMGIRLSGPAPKWARSDGGEGGSHPSNIHDCEYAVGTINFTGNMPIIIAQDGPSLGGFVCPCTIVQSELWKIGQLKAGDTIRFRQITIGEAIKARRAQNKFIRTLAWPSSCPEDNHCEALDVETKPVLRVIAKSDSRPRAEIRLAGDSYVLIEYGPMVLDLNLRFRVQFLEQELLRRSISGLEETAPGVRSLQLRYDPLVLPLTKLLDIVVEADSKLSDVSQGSVPTRILHLPMCFNYSGVDETIEKYMKSVRPQAPYLPSNIEYISQNNDLRGEHEVREKVFAASYMCIGLGDVYLGACCAVPINPLHRLVTSKYNPARTYTQEGTVGLGGSYMCIYPMNSPGGYQLVGRTLPIWDTFGSSNKRLFSKDKPWLLQMFDQIRFFSVSESELDEMRSKFRRGELELSVEEEVFSIAEYNRSVTAMASQIASYRNSQKEAIDVMLAAEQKSLRELEDTEKNGVCIEKPQVIDTSDSDGSFEVLSPVTGKVWDIRVSQGIAVTQDEVVASVEAMKMECACISPISGTVSRILVHSQQFVQQGDLIMTIRMNENETM